MLALFDIDGTLLLHASQAHRVALLAALSAVHGLDDPAAHRLEAAGRTDTQIARAIALAGGLTNQQFDARLPDFQRRCAELFDRECPPSLAAHVAPGVPELLDALSSDAACKLSLLTGNYEPIARLKLARAGIGHYFPADQGAFGSDAEQRELLGPIARARAGTPNAPYSREQTTIIGDTPLDIACARADGLRVIAIATGPHVPAELAGADQVVHDAFELQELLAAGDW